LFNFTRVEDMADEGPTEQSPGMESDSSQNEKKLAAAVDDLDMPDPDAHLSEADRKAIVCAPWICHPTV
jgi:hypothetical protein